MKPIKTYEKKYQNSEEVFERYDLVSESGKKLGTFQKIEEGQSLSRVWKHSKNGFAMLSAFRNEYSEKENLNRHEKLKKELRKFDLGFFEVDRVYQDESEMINGKFNPAGKVDNELSLFVPFREELYSFEEFEDIIMDAGYKYTQDSVLISEPESLGGKAKLIFRDGREVYIGTNIGLDKTSDMFSALRKGSHRGRSFVVESLGMRKPSSFYEAHELKAEGIKF